MGDYFDNTMGRFFKSGRAKIRIKPKLRAMIREKFDCTNEEVDEALMELASDMTEQVHSDIDYLKDRGEKEQAAFWKRLAEKRRNKTEGRT